ncbi:MAG TPA: diguanylate cyclase [Polyangiaceae bacterium]
MARKHRAVRQSGFVIALVDDDADYLHATRLLLESEGHRTLVASNGTEALDLLRREPVDLVLLDYFMPGMTGEEVVSKLREFDSTTQVILQTGYANEHPPREMLRRLDIQGYYDKSEGPEKLLLWADAGLKAADAIGRLTRSRRGLRSILEASPVLHRIQPLTDLYDDVLEQAQRVVGATSALLAVFPESGAPALVSAPPVLLGEARKDDSYLVVQARSGRFADVESMTDALTSEQIDELSEVLRSGNVQRQTDRSVVPLRVGDLTLGALWLEHPPLRDEVAELLMVYANQATVAVQNMVLYEMAALDPLTGVHARRFFENWMRREVRTAFRSQQCVSLLMLDMDGLKEVNDLAGHLAGDQALAMVGKVLRVATRENDVVGRFGGDEFAVVLPQTDTDGAESVGERLLELLRERTIQLPNGPRPLSGSVGLATLPIHEFGGEGFNRPIAASYFQAMAEALLERADGALYVAKASGKNRLCTAEPVTWAYPTSMRDSIG